MVEYRKLVRAVEYIISFMAGFEYGPVTYKVQAFYIPNYVAIMDLSEVWDSCKYAKLDFYEWKDIIHAYDKCKGLEKNKCHWDEIADCICNLLPTDLTPDGIKKSVLKKKGIK